MSILLKKIIRIFIYLIVMLVLFLGFFYMYENRNPHYVVLSESDKLSRAEILKKNSYRPLDYVLNKFSSHQIVMLGEPHRVSNHYKFLISILRELPSRNVNYFALELFSPKSQEKIDTLLNSSEMNEELARKIIFEGAEFFYYQEFYDILYEVWKLNRSNYKLKLIAMYNPNNPDEFMAEKVASIAKKGEKILFYSGTHHAFTRYSQPGIFPLQQPKDIYRMGQLLIHKHKLDPFFIQLHQPFPKNLWLFIPFYLYQKGFVYPFSGILDQVFDTLKQPVGFDTNIEYFKELVDSFSYYSKGYSKLKLSHFSDGYIYLNPLNEDKAVAPLNNICEDFKECVFIQQTNPRFAHLFKSKENAQRLIKKDGLYPEVRNSLLDEGDLKIVSPNF